MPQIQAEVSLERDMYVQMTCKSKKSLLTTNRECTSLIA